MIDITVIRDDLIVHYGERDGEVKPTLRQRLWARRDANGRMRAAGTGHTTSLRRHPLSRLLCRDGDKARPPMLARSRPW